MRFGTSVSQYFYDSVNVNSDLTKELVHINDFELGAKVNILEGDANLAVLAHAVIPNSVGGGSDDFGLISRIAFSHGLGQKLGMGYNIGYNYLGGLGDGDLTYSIVAGFDISEKLALFSEFYGKYANFELFMLNYDNGLTYLVKENLQLDFSVGTGVLESEFNFYSLGFTWRI